MKKREYNIITKLLQTYKVLNTIPAREAPSSDATVNFDISGKQEAL